MPHAAIPDKFFQNVMLSVELATYSCERLFQVILYSPILMIVLSLHVLVVELLSKTPASL